MAELEAQQTDACWTKTQNNQQEASVDESKTEVLTSRLSQDSSKGVKAFLAYT